MDPITGFVSLTAFGLFGLFGLVVLRALTPNAQAQADLRSAGYKRLAKVWVKTVGAVRVQVKENHTGEDGPRVDVEISRIDGSSLDIGLHLVGTFERVQSIEHVFLGSLAIDEHMHLEGDPDLLLVRFDSRVREQALALSGGHGCTLVIKDGTVNASAPLEGAIAYLEQLVAFAQSVLRDADAKELGARFLSEPDGGVRDRIAAAIFTGHLQLLPQIAAAARIDPHTGVRSVIAMVDRNAAELAIALTWSGMTPRRALACVKLLTELKDQAAAPGLRAAVLNPLLKDVRVEIIDALIACKDAGCETEMLAVFDSGDTPIKHATVRWFTDHGSARCVARLRRLEGTLLASLSLKAEARVALGEVRERVGPLGGGELSLDDDETEGAVSVDKEPRDPS